MNTAEFKTASARPGDPVHSIMEGISHSSIMAVVKTTNQHPMSAAVSLITCHLATLHSPRLRQDGCGGPPQALRRD